VREQLSANIHIQVVYRTAARHRAASLHYWHGVATVQECHGKLSVDTGDTRLQAVSGQK